MKQLQTTACLLFMALLFSTSAMASDFIIKYYIFSMVTEQDQAKVVDFIKSHPGVQKVETILDRHWLYLYLDDDIQEDERFKIRVPLAKMGYPVDRWEVLLEKPDSHD